MNSLQKRIAILTCAILAFILFYVAYEEFRWNSTAIPGLLLGICLLYGLGRFIRDFRRRDITPPSLRGGLFPEIGEYAPREPVRWDRAQTIGWMLKGLVALIVGTVIVVLIAKYYPEHLPSPRR